MLVVCGYPKIGFDREDAKVAKRDAKKYKAI